LLTRADTARASNRLISGWTISKGFLKLNRKRLTQVQDSKIPKNIIPCQRIKLNLLATIIPESKLQMSLSKVLKIQRSLRSS
jgi:hypothetical protein